MSHSVELVEDRPLGRFLPEFKTPALGDVHEHLDQVFSGLCLAIEFCESRLILGLTHS